MPDIREGNIYEPDRRTIIANDIVVDVIANEDGSVYVETYAYESGRRVEVSDLHVDYQYDPHPNLRLMLHGRATQPREWADR
jgi:hypothetical protein